MSNTTGRITGVNGNMITVFFEAAISLNEVGYARAGDLRLKAEVVRIRGSYADLQVFEDTSDLRRGRRGGIHRRIC
jgi:V/A-type H+-transporting ATPase subunit A